MRLRAKTRSGEQGFALLLVFLMAAAVAFTLYRQLPRVAFESVREKEQILIDRGNQYKRAIEVYYAVNKRYPAKIEDLENTNQKRYLRRRYKDPMTGKDEWRMVHTNGSFLTDSLVEKPPQQNGQQQNAGLPGGGPLGTNNLNTANLSAAGNATTNTGTGTPGDGAVNTAVNQRPSDRTGGAEGFQNQGRGFGGGFNNGAPQGYDPNDPRTWPAITVPSNPNGQNNNQNNQGQAGQPPNGGPGGFPGSFPSSAQPGFNPNQQQNPFQGRGQIQNPNFQNGNFQQNGPPGQIRGPGVLGQFPGAGGQNPQNVNLGGNFGGGNPGSDGGNGNPFPTNPFPTNSFPANPGDNLNGPPQNAVQFPGGANPALELINGQLTRPGGQQPNPNGNSNSTGGNPFGNNNQGGTFGSIAPNGVAPNGAAGNNGTANGGIGLGGGPLGGANNGGANGGGGPGIAGVASRHEGPSIKSYRERTKYQEWEFVYRPNAQGQAGAQPGAANPLNNNGGGNNGPGNNQNGGTSPSNPFGNSGSSPNGSAGPGNGQGGIGPPAGGLGNPFGSPQGR